MSVASSATVDLSQETLLPLSAAARRFPAYRQGRPVNASTVWRWCRQGVRVRGSDERVRLEHCRLAGRWLTSVEAISRFIARQTPATEAMPPIRTPQQRSTAASRAARELDAAGL